MNRFACRAAAGAVLALGIGLLTASTTQSADENKEINQAILKLADQVGKAPAEVKKQAQAIYKKAGPDGLGDVMQAFKPRNKGGVGVGKKAGAITPDGIELKIIALGRRALPAGTLGKQKEAMVRMAKVTEAIGDVADLYTPPKKAGTNPNDWKKFNQQMKKGAQELAKAAQSGDPMKLKTAANNLNAACNDCHSAFRD